MPKKKTPARALAVSTGPTTYPIANTTVAATQLFKVPDRHPGGDGPWNDEADKIGWIDERTGRQCIILRQANGTLSGYVAVEPAHPLFGYRHDAVPGALGVSVHGGLTYAAPCEQNLPEPVSVCHMPPKGMRSARQNVFENEDLWWFGFDTDHAYDFVPKVRGGSANQISDGKVYRDQAYVYRECIRLAAQLHFNETGVEVPIPVELQQTVPPIGGTER